MLDTPCMSFTCASRLQVWWFQAGNQPVVTSSHQWEETGGALAGYGPSPLDAS